MFTPKPTDHKGGYPFLVGAFGAQNGTSSPSCQSRIEDLGNRCGLEGPPEQYTHEPDEAGYANYVVCVGRGKVSMNPRWKYVR